jgi:hypothetical protein
MIRRFGSAGWEKHHLAENRISRALGMEDKAARDTSPAINLPRSAEILSPQQLADYQAKFGRNPVFHQGPDGIKTAIDKIFRDNQFPYQQTLTPAQQQTLINELHSLYAQDSRFMHLKLWPATRDWLKAHFSGGSLNIPD